MDRPIEPRLLKGFRDFLPEEEARRSRMLRIIAEAFELCGFVPLQTPAIEYLDILTGKYGDEGEKLLYKFKDHGGREVALRYDLTVPLARVVVQYPNLTKPLKRYQIGVVWRAEKPAHGRFREFLQCDADIVGSPSPLADAECIVAGITALEALGLEFEVRIGHRAVLNALLAHHGIEQPSVQIAVLRLIDKSEKIGRSEATRLIFELIGQKAQSLVEDVWSLSEGLSGEVEHLAAGAIFHVRKILEALEHYGVAHRVRTDFSIARGLDYYTGTVFETFLKDTPSVGSVMSGGRYDTLTSVFGEQDCPAVGLSIGVDRLFSALEESGRLPEVRLGPVVVVCPVGEGLWGPALKILATLRKAGIASEIAPDHTWRLKKALQYASRRRALFAVIIGEEEASFDGVSLRNLLTGEQKIVSIADLPLVVAHTLGSKEDKVADR